MRVKLAINPFRKSARATGFRIHKLFITLQWYQVDGSLEMAKMKQESIVDFLHCASVLKDILENVIRDEETHRELLSKMKKILVGEEKPTADNTSQSKYQHPDAWSRAMPDWVYENAR